MIRKGWFCFGLAKLYKPSNTHIICDKTAAQRSTTGPTSQKFPIRQVTVPKQGLLHVSDANETARKLGGMLAGILETLMNISELNKMKDKYFLAVSPCGLPKSTGWFQVDRRNASTNPISPDMAKRLITAGYWDEVLYVDQSATGASESSHPLALSVAHTKDVGCYLSAFFWPAAVARVALSMPEQGRAESTQPVESKPAIRSTDMMKNEQRQGALRRLFGLLRKPKPPGTNKILDI